MTVAAEPVSGGKYYWNPGKRSGVELWRSKMTTDDSPGVPVKARADAVKNARLFTVALVDRFGPTVNHSERFMLSELGMTSKRAVSRYLGIAVEAEWLDVVRYGSSGEHGGLRQSTIYTIRQWWRTGPRPKPVWEDPEFIAHVKVAQEAIDRMSAAPPTPDSDGPPPF